MMTPLGILADHFSAAWTLDKRRLIGIVHVRFVGKLAIIKLVVFNAHETRGTSAAAKWNSGFGCIAQAAVRHRRASSSSPHRSWHSLGRDDTPEKDHRRNPSRRQRALESANIADFRRFDFRDRPAAECCG